ncbi:hypothetical protein MGN70_010624 [Eutypa lata]|nr:hypothetical protein MGN70_010624 [Eutypa lata]
MDDKSRSPIQKRLRGRSLLSELVNNVVDKLNQMAKVSIIVLCLEKLLAGGAELDEHCGNGEDEGDDPKDAFCAEHIPSCG